MIRFASLLLFACHDYNIKKKDEPPADPIPVEEPILEPLFVMDPLNIAVEGVCGEFNKEITLMNLGEGELEIQSLDLVASGWSIEQVSTPFWIPSGQARILNLSTDGSGSGFLQVLSNDPVSPEKWMELYSTPDMPPEVQITSPHNGAVIPIDGGVMTAIVSDLEDPAEEIEIEWRSDIDGLMSSDTPLSDGSYAFDFLSENHGDHEISLLARDSCGNETEFFSGVCQQYGYEVENLDISTWHFEGSANWDAANEWVELTPVANYVVGSAFSTAIAVDGGNVEIEFMFYIGDGTGADGISLTALDIDRMDGFLGGTGCGMGYGGDAGCTPGPALPGWSLEIDTYYNGGLDPTSADHLAFTFDGDVDGAVDWKELPEMEDTGWHHAIVKVSAPNVRVQIDGVVYMDAEMQGHFNFPAYIGFTAGTGGATNNHLIDSLTVTELVCGEE